MKRILRRKLAARTAALYGKELDRWNLRRTPAWF